MNLLREQAQMNLDNLTGDPYRGRGIVVGVSEDGKNMVQVYWIMGRSANSRNRVFSVEGGRVFTEPADPTQGGDTRLTLYNAMAEDKDIYVVSNGEQTDSVLEEVGRRGNDLLNTLESSEFKYEPDAPNFTPRITAVATTNDEFKSMAELAILRKSPWDDGCDRLLYQYSSIEPGFGYCVTTYQRDDPQRHFRGEPILMPLTGTIGEVVEMYWAALNEGNRVSLAVKFINLESGKSNVRIVNKYKKLAAAV